MGEAERGDSAPRRRIYYYCEQGHESSPSFALEAVIPDSWDCPRCGLPDSQDREHPPPAPRNEPYKTHLGYVKERRSDEDGAALLDEALQALRQRRNL
jgi:rubredoxin